VLALEDLSSRGRRGISQRTDSKSRVGLEGGRSHHASAGEIHSLMRASHASVRICLERSLLVSMNVEDNEEHKGEALVVMNLAEERKSSFENFDSRSYNQNQRKTWWRKEMAHESCVDVKGTR
jgi:hypothetical protein